MLINIHTGKYASLDHWYNNISVKEKEIELKNDYDGRSMILKMLMGLSGFRNVKCKCWFYIKGEEQWPKKE